MLYNNKRITLLFISLLLFVGSATAGVTSTFDSNLEGWTFTSGVTWADIAGNPGGYIRFEDDGPADGGQILAPAGFLGDWTIYEGGTLSYDFRSFFTEPPGFNRTVDISGPGGIARWQAPNIDPSDGWVTLQNTVSESTWVLQSGSWAGLIANVTELRIYMPDSSTASEITGIDNVSLTPVPLPAALILFLSGMVGLACINKRKK